MATANVPHDRNGSERLIQIASDHQCTVHDLSPMSALFLQSTPDEMSLGETAPLRKGGISRER